jgi:methionine salvage enolase-phosphatase E1
VTDALVEWRNAGLKTYIYSSGSREAQRQLFGHTQVLDFLVYTSEDVRACVHAYVLLCAQTLCSNLLP